MKPSVGHLFVIVHSIHRNLPLISCLGSALIETGHFHNLCQARIGVPSVGAVSNVFHCVVIVLGIVVECTSKVEQVY